MNRKFLGCRVWFAVGAVLCAVFFLSVIALASTNISSDPAYHWIWNDVIGWINLYGTGDVAVTSAGLTGEASSSAGLISFNCNGASSVPAYNFCGTYPYSVVNDGAGNLSGWAWNDTYGWISFCGGQGTANCPGDSVHYRVIIDQNGNFSGYAWNDFIGWISFNCNQPDPPSNTCSPYSYGIQTSWVATSTSGYLDSQTFDTGVSGGAELNSFLWHGPALPAGTSVGFQFAVSNSSSGPWNFVGPNGVWNSTSSYWNATAPSSSVPLDYNLYNNFRYFRYRITLFSNMAQTATPRVDDVIINWSP